jgi:solute carrier family 25 (mitochondrial phosphate transporter), member 23/24/25/41
MPVSNLPVCSSESRAKLRNHTPKAEIQSAEKNMIAGGMAGCIGKTFTAPLSRLTVLYQVGPLLERHHGGEAITQDSIWKTLRSVVKREGILSMWNGNLVSILHRFPYSAINFSVYEAAKNHMGSGDDNHDSSFVRFSCGAIAGLVACVSCYPLDIVRTRLAVGGVALSSSSSTINSRSKAVNIVLSILEKEGVFGLYRGLGASLSVVMPNLALGFTVYGKIKETMIDQKGVFVNSETGHLNIFGALLSGCLSGATSSMLLFPLDVIRKRLQVVGVVHDKTAPAIDGPPPRQGMLYHARMIFAHHGLRGFYRGLGSEILKVCPMVAITFSSYEVVKDILDARYPNSENE